MFLSIRLSPSLRWTYNHHETPVPFLSFTLWSLAPVVNGNAGFSRPPFVYGVFFRPMLLMPDVRGAHSIFVFYLVAPVLGLNYPQLCFGSYMYRRNESGWMHVGAHAANQPPAHLTRLSSLSSCLSIMC